MGQRHQIYIRMPACDYGANNPNNKPEQTFGFHHQWLYGATALEMLDQFLRFHGMQNEYSGLKKNTHDTIDTILAVFSVLNNCSYESVSKCGDDISGNFGNNDGITVIDLTTDKPQYCFASLGHTEGKISLTKGIYTALEYLESYYPGLDSYAEVKGRGGMDMPEVVNRLNNFPLLSPERLAEILPGWKGI